MPWRREGHTCPSGCGRELLCSAGRSLGFPVSAEAESGAGRVGPRCPAVRSVAARPPFSPPLLPPPAADARAPAVVARARRGAPLWRREELVCSRRRRGGAWRGVDQGWCRAGAGPARRCLLGSCCGMGQVQSNEAGAMWCGSFTKRRIIAGNRFLVTGMWMGVAVAAQHSYLGLV